MSEYNKNYYRSRKDVLKARATQVIVNNRRQRIAMIAEAPRPENCALCAARLVDTVTLKNGQTRPGFSAYRADGMSLHQLAYALVPIAEFDEALYSPDTQWVCASCNQAGTNGGGPQRSLSTIIVEACASAKTVDQLVAIVSSERSTTRGSIGATVYSLVASGRLTRVKRGVYALAKKAAKSRKKGPFKI